MSSTIADSVELFDYAWGRFRERMEGVDDAELMWAPTSDPDLSLRWRLGHIAELLGESRNGPWLGLSTAAERVDEATDSAAGPPSQPASAVQVFADLDASYAHWRSLLTAADDSSIAEPIGAVAGPYGDSSRFSFVLHVADELIHHTAEAALLRDLYAGREKAARENVRSKSDGDG